MIICYSILMVFLTEIFLMFRLLQVDQKLGIKEVQDWMVRNFFSFLLNVIEYWVCHSSHKQGSFFLFLFYKWCLASSGDYFLCDMVAHSFCCCITNYGLKTTKHLLAQRRGLMERLFKKMERLWQCYYQHLCFWLICLLAILRVIKECVDM